MAVNGITELTLALRDALKEEDRHDILYLTLSPVPTNTHGADPLYRFNATVASSCHWPPEAKAQPKCGKHAPNHDTDTDVHGSAHVRFVNLTLDWLEREWAGEVDFVSTDLNVTDTDTEMSMAARMSGYYGTPYSSCDSSCEMSMAARMLGYYGTPYSSCDLSLWFVNLTLDWLEREWAGEVDFVSADLNVAG
ncbi:hypothetical protein BU17DRAFT_70228 [Hysterangium stoloniferum]|nr:hypothetical protein BU17DRAFT_70228 [Hysterangium stoloniferum]